MLIRNANDAKLEIPKMDGVKGVSLRWLVSKEQGARNYAMRLFEIEPGGLIPMHDHKDSEHEIFVLEGEALLKTPEKNYQLKPGLALFVEPGDSHSFVNTSDRTFKFLCVIPLK
jgi:quercetin dioxygenase-like cupin family protein